MADIITENDLYCKLRNPMGSEYGTCPCLRPTDCPDPPQMTGMQKLFIQMYGSGEKEEVN